MQYIVDLENAITKQLFPPGVQGLANGSAQDMSNADASTNFLLSVGVVTGAGTVVVQESDDQSVWSALTTFDATVSGTNNYLTARRVLRTKRYVRGSFTGTTAQVNFGLTAVAQPKFGYASADGNGGYSLSPTTV